MASVEGADGFVARINWNRVDEDHPVGEIPGAEVPGKRIVQIRGLRNKEQLKGAKRRGPLRSLIEGLRKTGRHVRVLGLAGVGEVILFVASSREVVGVPHFSPKRRKNNEKK